MQKSVTIVLSGEAGQGLSTIEELLVEAISGVHYIFSTSEVMSRVRGGNNSVELRIGEEPVYAFRHEIDFLFLLNDHALSRLERRITPKTKIIGEEVFSAGGALFKNMSIFGYIAGMLELEKETCLGLISNQFKNKTEKIIADNQMAFAQGFEAGGASKPVLGLKRSQLTGAYQILDGTKAVGIGALGGGCNFVASYPMSPGTGLLTFMAQKALAHGVIVEQAEDEIAALNMVIGAWYAGARGLVTTSGGGFSLMEEAVSLAGMTETPCVIHLGQRPGPATGLPTRTEQADLNLVVYAGHGEFPRIVFTPGKLSDAVLLSQKAFYLADKYQVPVFILTDQFFLESKGQMEGLVLSEQYLFQFIEKTTQDYQRYSFHPSGVSPRGIPGYGTGSVAVDSDEHDESGRITEDFDMRTRMNDKRLAKEKLILEDFEDPELIGPSDYSRLVVGWGSTYGVLKEFVDTAGRKDVAFLYVKQVYPLHPRLAAYFKQAEKIVVVENNGTGQFADLLALKLKTEISGRVLKYSGEPFSIEEIEQRLLEVL